MEEEAAAPKQPEPEEAGGAGAGAAGQEQEPEAAPAAAPAAAAEAATVEGGDSATAAAAEAEDCSDEEAGGEAAAAQQEAQEAAAAAAAGGGKTQGGGGTAIIVPYRDLHPEQQRGKHLQQFLERMPGLLAPHCPALHIYVVEQSDDGRKFNRGKLLNIGFRLAEADGREVFVFHDVDLLPSPELAPCYARVPAKGPLHIARVWGRYSGNPKYMGGAVAFSKGDFERINGFPNTFWGWGGEDDEMRKRVDEAASPRMEVEAPTEGSMEDLESQSLEEKLQTLRAHREWKCNVKWEALNEHAATWRTNGLADLDYALLATEHLGPHATKYTVDVKLNGHWTDTVFHIDAPNDGVRGGRGRGRRRGGGGGHWRGGGRGHHRNDDRGGGHERDHKRQRV